jgi:hypothetical protein
MKESISNNVISVFSKVKGKKPVIIVATVIVAIVGYLAVQKGYISQAVVDSFISSGKIDSMFTMPAADIVK